MADRAVTSSEAPCAPPPQTIIGFLAAPRSLAALRIAVSSSFGARIGLGACGVTEPDLPQTSIAHCSEAGPGRPVAIACPDAAPARASGSMPNDPPGG